MTKRRTWVSKFKPGDVVVFTGPALFNGRTSHHDFQMGVEYTVHEAETRFGSQLDAFSRPHALLSADYPNGSPDGHGQWVDEECLDFANPEPTQEEIAELFGMSEIPKPPVCPTCHQPVTNNQI